METDAITGPDTGSQTAKSGLSSAKREDIWALIIALAALAFSFFAPDAVHRLFDKILYFL